MLEVWDTTSQTCGKTLGLINGMAPTLRPHTHTQTGTKTTFPLQLCGVVTALNILTKVTETGMKQ